MNTYKETFKLTCGREGSLDYIRLDDISGGFSVKKTFDCGQCFRFDPVADTKYEAEYAGVAFGRPVSFAEDSGTVFIFNSNESDFYELWMDYLGLDRDYDAINADIIDRSDKPVLASALEVGRGIRILSQEHWETLCSFIISQNNNIPRIKKIIANMSRELGDKVDTHGMEGHLSDIMLDGAYCFPSADTIREAGIDAISALRTGFRAKYICDAAEKVSNGSVSLDKIAELDSPIAAAELMKIKGVGPKVAACTLLFGFSKYDAFPIDVWIKRVMAKYFPSDFTPESLGSYAGIAQQYLFYYERFLGGE